MSKILLKELGMNSRNEVLIFLKKLWNEEKVNCPICNNELELLHKKDNNDWQCKKCNKTYKTLYLLDELNEQMPK